MTGRQEPAQTTPGPIDSEGSKGVGFDCETRNSAGLARSGLPRPVPAPWALPVGLCPAKPFNLKIQPSGGISVPTYLAGVWLKSQLLRQSGGGLALPHCNMTNLLAAQLV